MTFEPPPERSGTPPAAQSTPLIVPNVLRDPATGSEPTPPPKRRSRGMIISGIAILAGLVGTVGGKILIGLLAANVAGAAASALFGGPWDKLPSDVKNAYEKRLETAVGNRLEGMANAQQETQVATWLRSGYSRLDDRRLTRHLELEVDALNKTDVGTCAAFGRSSIAGTPIDTATSNKIVGALDQASMVEFLGMNVEAIEAELRGSPTPIHVTSAQTSASFQQMIGGLSQAEILVLGNLSSGQTASDTDTCNAIRGLYREALQLDPASKAVVARFDIDPS